MTDMEGCACENQSVRRGIRLELADKLAIHILQSMTLVDDDVPVSCEGDWLRIYSKGSAKTHFQVKPDRYALSLIAISNVVTTIGKVAIVFLLYLFGFGFGFPTFLTAGPLAHVPAYFAPFASDGDDNSLRRSCSRCSGVPWYWTTGI